jgi:hypothetical protein
MTRLAEQALQLVLAVALRIRKRELVFLDPGQEALSVNIYIGHL